MSRTLDSFKFLKVLGTLGGTFVLITALALMTGCRARTADPKAFYGKKVVTLDSVGRVDVDLLRITGDERTYAFGPDFDARLTTKLTERSKVIVSPGEISIPPRDDLRMQTDAPPVWVGRYVPSAQISFHIEALNFVTGSRGTRMFYGFDERQPLIENEFPLKAVEFEPNWFDRSFDAKGSRLFGSRSGLDLGEGIRLDLLAAWLTLKFAAYRSELSLRIRVSSPWSGVDEWHRVKVRGKGYFFDLVSQYEQWSGGIMIARQDAMLQAFRKTVDGSAEKIESFLDGLPLMAIVDEILEDGRILLGTGKNANIKVGTVYQRVDRPEVALEVVQSASDGAVARLLDARGAIDSKKITKATVSRLIARDHIVKQVFSSDQVKPLAARAGSALQRSVASLSPSSIQVVDLPSENLEKPEELKSYKEDRWRAFLKSLGELVFLPYRIWRSHQYDQAYKKPSSVEDVAATPPLQEPENETDATAQPLAKWLESIQKTSWAKQIRLPKEIPSVHTKPVIAVIDTGIDYNHPWIHPFLWLNPYPTKDTSGREDRYGWDFVSGDSRPYDDHRHGTQTASTLLSVAPFVQILPLKIFNPYGITSSGAIHSAFEYAIKAKVDAILTPWATRRESAVLQSAIERATHAGIPVFVAAGDRGSDLDLEPSYPAAFSRADTRVIVVSALDANDRLVEAPGQHSNFGKESVTIAAPGFEIEVAEPRGKKSVASGTHLSAAFVAGAYLREKARFPEGNVDTLLERVKSKAREVPALNDVVQGGRVLDLKYGF